MWFNSANRWRHHTVINYQGLLLVLSLLFPLSHPAYIVAYICHYNCMVRFARLMAQTTCFVFSDFGAAGAFDIILEVFSTNKHKIATCFWTSPI